MAIATNNVSSRALSLTGTAKLLAVFCLPLTQNG